MTERQIDAHTIFHFFNEIGIISQLSGNAMEKVLPDGMTMPQFSVLNHFVRLDKEETPLQLAVAFQVTKGAMTNTLGHLESQGFINVRPHERDKRSKLISISEAGRDAHRRSLEALAPALEEIDGAFDVADLKAALPLLERMRIWLDERRNRD